MKSRKYHINNSTINVVFGNIIGSKAEVIVSSDDTDISMGGGVSMAIRNSGGDIVMKDAQKKLPTQLGEVIVSTSGALQYQKFIFHCITISYSNQHGLNDIRLSSSMDIQTYIIQHAVDKCFNLIHTLDIDSIAFPCIGAGMAHFPMQKVAKVMAQAISSNLYKTQKQIEVELYLYDRYNKLNEIDYIDFFENFAINSAIVKQCNIIELNSLTTEENISITMNNSMNIPQKADMNHKVFISYSRKDSEKVNYIKENILDKYSIKYWLDRDGIYSGENYKEVIVDAIDSSLVILFFSSDNSNQSIHVIRELEYAIKQKKTIIPILLDDAQYAKSIRLDLSNIDHIDIRDNSSVEKKLLISLDYSLGIKSKIK